MNPLNPLDPIYDPSLLFEEDPEDSSDTYYVQGEDGVTEVVEAPADWTSDPQ